MGDKAHMEMVHKELDCCSQFVDTIKIELTKHLYRKLISILALDKADILEHPKDGFYWNNCARHYVRISLGFPSIFKVAHQETE